MKWVFTAPSEMNNKKLIPVFLFLMITNCLLSQTLTEFSGQPINGAARTASLGGAAVGEAYDVNAMYWNPAALSFLQQSSVTISSILGRSGQSFDNTLSLPPLYADNYLVVAAGIAGSYYGKDWSKPYFAYHGIDLGYSIKLNHTVSVGVLMNVRYGNSSRSGLWATSGTIGGFYAPSSGISYGIVYSGIGLGVLYNYDGNAEAIAYKRNIGQSVGIGSSFRFPSLYRLPYITLTFECQKFIDISGITYRGGIETYPSKIVSLRLGIIANSIGTTGTFGLGFNIGHLHIDYAYAPSRALDRFHQISISYQLGT